MKVSYLRSTSLAALLAVTGSLAAAQEVRVTVAE